MFRAAVVSFLACAVGAAAVYACSSSSSAPPAPPVNEGGSDVVTGDVTPPPGDGPNTMDGGDGGVAPLCSGLPGTVVYIESGDTQQQVLDILGRQLRDRANITIVFLLTGSCTIVPGLYQNTPIPKNTNMLYVPSTAENPTWMPGQPESTCVTDPNNGTPPDLGISALFPSSCAMAGPPPPNIGTFIGPIQAYTFVVSPGEFASGQTSISAEEAYYALGDGVNNPVTWNANMEWNVPTEFYLRPATKSTLVSTAFNIGLTPKQATLVLADGGTQDGRKLLASSTDVVTGVAASTSMQNLGILGSVVYDINRSKINVLAFSAFGQSTRYYPDSTTTSFDKENLRNGNYTLWSPAVLLTPVDGSGVPTNPNVKFFADLMLGNPGATPPGGYVDGGTPIDGLGAIVSAGLTPDCAMQVQRSSDGAPVMPYTPTAPCTCYYLSKVPNAAPLPASCVPCSATNSCEAGSCFNGYCEVTPPPTIPVTMVTKTNLVIPRSADGGLLPPNP